MRVLITGGVGLIGRAVAQRLGGSGWQVKLIDVVPEDGQSGSAYSICDITDYEALREQVRGCDAIVHLAALRNPYYAPAPEIFRVNVAGTFNVFEAAAAEGIRRVVQASSINAIGCAWNITDFCPQYFPVDESHPSATTDPYSFSKIMIEDVGHYYWRRDGISSVALRFPGVHEQGYYKSPQYFERRDGMRELVDELLCLPEVERQRQLDEVRNRALVYRSERPMEYPEKTPRPGNFEGISEALWKAYTFDRFNLWTFIDERDAAQAVEKALIADFEGSHPLFVNDQHNWVDYDSRLLAHLFFPDVIKWIQPVEGAESLVSIERARELIGFEPEYSIHEDNHA